MVVRKIISTPLLRFQSLKLNIKFHHIQEFLGLYCYASNTTQHGAKQKDTWRCSKFILPAQLICPTWVLKFSFHLPVLTPHSILSQNHTHAYAHTIVQSRLHCHCLIVAYNGGHSPSAGFPNGPQHRLQASHNNSSQQFNHSSSLTNLPANWPCL